MSVDSIKNTIIVALGVCFVSSILVSASVVTLKPRQVANMELDKLKNILSAADLYTNDQEVKEIYAEKIRPEVINLKDGSIVPESELDVMLAYDNFDIKKISKDSEYSDVLDGKKDIAGIKRLPGKMIIYKVMEGDVVEKYILPLYGNGLWSTLYGFLALDKDLITIRGFTFYEHGETPGLGGEVDNPRWKAQWNGKQVFDEEGKVCIEVLKGMVDPSSEKAKYQIDGLSGSTLTSRGVSNLVRFWMDENGYGPFFSSLRKEG